MNTTASEYRKRSSAKVAAQHKYLIEGEYVSSREIAERLNIKYSTAASRLQREQRKAGPVTWAGLGA